MSLHFDNVSYRYSRFRRSIINQLDVTFTAGVTLLLGPNGAGKTTLINLAGALGKPTSGQIEFNGVVSTQVAAYRALSSVMPQHCPAAPGLTVWEQVALSAWLKGASRAEAWHESKTALDQVGLSDCGEMKAAELSGGQRARLGLAQALAHHAPLLLLDEPTASLDPDQRHSVWALLGDISVKRTIVVATHDIADLTHTCEQVVVMDAGGVRFNGTAAQFLADTSPTNSTTAYRHWMAQ
ncbi:MAG: ATP-binding cassette domain-containing protein [Actinomycetota bacterium]